MKNWKTTLLGALAGLAMLFGNAVQSRQSGGAPITIGNLLGPAMVTLLGLVSKDHNVTGGTTVQ